MESEKRGSYRWGSLLLSLVLLFLLLVGGAHAKEGLSFAIDPSWTFLRDETVGRTYLMTFLPAGQTDGNWQSRFEILEVSRKDYPKKVEEAQAGLLNIRLKSCPDTRSEILEQDKTSLIFEMVTFDCAPQPDQDQITRILYGKKKAYVMTFTHRAGEVPPGMRDGWLKVLRAASIR